MLDLDPLDTGHGPRHGAGPAAGTHQETAMPNPSPTGPEAAAALCVRDLFDNQVATRPEAVALQALLELLARLG